jgi:uncharacterized spore protein YtfJ
MKARAKMELDKANSADRFIGTIAEKLGAVARAETIFAEPIERDGITVIPVAKARWGFGGGLGHTKDEHGAGGGGGVTVTPVGFIEVKDGQAEFRSIGTSLPWILAGATALLLLRQTIKQR